MAVSKPLPLARYEIIESKAADFYGLDQTPIEVEIEYAGQIVKAAMTNKSLYTNVSIQKTGYVEVMPGQQIRYDLSSIANNSTYQPHILLLEGHAPHSGGAAGQDCHWHLQRAGQL